MKTLVVALMTSLALVGCSNDSGASNDGSGKDPAGKGDTSGPTCLKTQTPFEGQCWYSYDVDDLGIRLRQLDTKEVKWLYQVGASNIGKFATDLKHPGSDDFRRGTLKICDWPMNFPTEAGVLEAHCPNKIDASNEYKIVKPDGVITLGYEAESESLKPENRRLIRISFDPR